MQENATIDNLNPQRTQEYPNESKVTSSSKKSAIVGALLFKPQPSFGAEWEHGTSVERTMNFAQITELDMRGFVLWGFYIADRFDQGKAASADQLPCAHFLLGITIHRHHL